MVQRMPVPQAFEQLGQKWRQALGADAVEGGPAHAQQRHLSRSIARRSPATVRDTLLGWRMTEQYERVLAGVAADGTELIQELALLSSAGVHVARRQRPRQVVPTGLLHPLIVVASGRIRFEADRPCRVGKILRQRGVQNGRS